jgi:Phage integrase, N-terminal SAM-like domain
MSVEKIQRPSGDVIWRVRWRQHGRNRARTFSTRRDAADFDAEVRRQRRAGGLTALDAGTESLGEYITAAWATTHAVTLAPKTRLHYASLYDHHLRPFLGSVALREIDPETVGRWQADRLAAGAGPVAVRQALDLLGSILEQAYTSGRISENPVRRVKKARLPRRDEV